ncbi:TetR/AcrR family transcriptional regulator [Georgenia halophila]|uniref:TetR/AcrR family transcriptional regulator n=1 Tax=Georgenia halophila TaxID=620889 RepID=A0ABP8LGW9_9MICO
MVRQTAGTDAGDSHAAADGHAGESRLVERRAVERRRPGPRAGLDVDKIVGAAIEIADSEGLNAVSMASVSTRLGFTPMSLYRHVGSKDELVERMQQAAIGPPARDVPPGWRAGLRAWTVEYVDRALEHPWVVDVPIYGPPRDPQSLRWLEQALRSLHGTPLAEGEKVGVALVLTNFARSTVSFTAGMRMGAQRAGASESPRYDEALRSVTDPETFPYLTRVLDSGVFTMPSVPGDAGLEDDFAFGLELVLDGVAALIDSRTRD